MNSRLPAMPDVALHEPPAIRSGLDWVGMQGIDLPLLPDAESTFTVAARVDAEVDLPDPAIKGIHMSRLYRLLDHIAAPHVLTPAAIDAVLQAMIASHADCQSSRARLAIGFSLLRRQAALVTPELHGWKTYPVTIDAVWQHGHLLLQLGVSVTYSSTCPCSAALARQVVQEKFNADFAGQQDVSRQEIDAWLGRYATVATPHSQRSIANVHVNIASNAATFGIASLIDLIEQALATPVQTAVKRVDEQAFARLNGANLMYVEDAARKVQHALQPYFQQSSVQVRHLESLHPHDAVAQVSSFINLPLR